MSALHEFRVDMAFGATPADVLLGATITWTDITDYVRLADGIQLSRGRSAEEGSVSAGRCQLNLNNDTGIFTYGNAHMVYSYLSTLYSTYADFAAAYPTYGTSDDYALRIRTPIRVTYLPPAADEIVLWTGTVDDFSLSWTNGKRAMVQVTATDMVARITRKTLEALPLQVALGMGSVVWAYPLDDTESTTSAGTPLAVDAADRSGNTDAPLLVKTRYGSGGSPTLSQGVGYSPGYVGSSAEVGVASWASNTASSGYGLQAGFNAGPHGWGQYPPTASDTGATLHAMVLPNSHTRVREVVTLQGFFSYSELRITATGKAQFYQSSPALTLTGTSTLSVADWSHVAVTQSESGGTVTAKLYVNGSVEDTDTYTADAVQPQGEFDLAIGALWSGVDMMDGNICNVVAHSTCLTAGQVAEIADGRDGFDADLAVTRFFRIARAAGLSTATTTGGASTMCVQYTKGMTAADAFAEITDAEIAPWWVDPEGQLQMAPRTTRYNTTSITTLDASTVDPQTSFSANDAFLINKATVSRPGGTVVTKVNADSLARYDEYLFDATLMVNSDTQTSDIAAWLVQTRAEPRSRSESFAVDLVTKQASVDVELCAALEIGNPFTVNGLPSTAPASSVDLFVEGVSDTINSRVWLRTINASPITTGTAWVLDSATLSVLDSSTIPAL